MLNDVNRLQTLAVLCAIIGLVLLGVYWVGYTNGRDTQILKQQKEALLMTEEAAKSAVAVQETMEKTDAQMQRASSVSDDCNFVLNFDLTPCGVFD